MDPIILAASFSNIVSLICVWRQERKSNESENSEVFLQWLDSHHHLETIEKIQSSKDLTEQVRKMIMKDTNELMIYAQEAKNTLNSISKKLTQVIESQKNQSFTRDLIDYQSHVDITKAKNI